MLSKKICPTHHFRYTGSRCPICESERVNGMAKRYIPKEETKIEEEAPKQETLDWSDLAEKFKVGRL